MKVLKTSETKHNELLSLLNPLIDFMEANGFNYFMVAGKDSICTRHLRGDYDDIYGMIKGLSDKNNSLRAMINDVVNSEKV